MIITAVIALSVETIHPTIKFVDMSERRSFSSNDMIASPANEKPGFYVFKDSHFTSKVLNKALDVLKDVDIPYVVKKEANGTLSSWRLDGTPESVKPEDLPKFLFTELKANQPAIKVLQTSSNLPMGLPRFNMMYNIPTNLNVDNPSPQRLNSWRRLGEPQSPYVRVLFRLHVPLEVGSLKAKTGVEKTIDGVNFKVGTAPHTHMVGYPVDETKIFNCDMVVDQMTFSKANPNQSYALSLKVDEAKYKKDFPADTTTERTYCSSSGATGTPYAIRFYVHSNRPYKYWKDLTVTQSSFLEGFMGHIPTAPIASH